MVTEQESVPGRIIVITGNMAAGKSTVAQALAERLPRSVHLRGDLFRRFIVNGRAQIDLDLSPEARRQLELRYELAVHSAKRYADHGFTVVYQDILLGDTLAWLGPALLPHVPLIVVLCPKAEVVAVREEQRGKSGYQDRAQIEAFDRVLREDTPRAGHWLDSSELSAAETVDDILALLDQQP